MWNSRIRPLPRFKTLNDPTGGDTCDLGHRKRLTDGGQLINGECPLFFAWHLSRDQANGPSNDGTYTEFTYHEDIKWQVLPTSLFEVDGDVPKLEGVPGGKAPPDVPAGTAGVYRAGKDLSGGASRLTRWDVSRQSRIKLINPNNLDFSQYPYYFDSVTHALIYADNQNWPNDPIGNDDADTRGESNVAGANNPIGTVSENDLPGGGVVNQQGNVGDTFEVHLQLRDFVRVELGTKYYRISDFSDWRIDTLFKKTAAGWQDNGSSYAKDHAGW